MKKMKKSILSLATMCVMFGSTKNLIGQTRGQGQKLGSNLKSDIFVKKSYRNYRS